MGFCFAMALMIDEIKSTSQPLDYLEPDGYPVHWAQAKMYAYMYLIDNDLKEMDVQLTYVQVETEEKRYLKKTFSLSELELFVFDVMKGYAPYAIVQAEHRIKRNQTSKELSFLFSTIVRVNGS